MIFSNFTIVVKTRNILFLLFILLINISCQHLSEDQAEVTKKEPVILWVTGNYILKSKYGTYYENWGMIDSSRYSGLGYYMDTLNVDTLFRQRMNLVKTNKDVKMYFNVKNQNNNKDVEFTLTKEENSVFTFENPFRDYPSVITYKLLNDTSINVIMFGFKNNKEKREDFIITKISR